MRLIWLINLILSFLRLATAAPHKILKGKWRWLVLILPSLALAKPAPSSHQIAKAKPTAQHFTFNRHHLAKRLHDLIWQDDSRCSICGGKFIYPAIDWPKQPGLETNKYDYNTIIEAQRQAYFHQNGSASLRGNVKIKQQSRILKAQEVDFTLNAKRDQIDSLTLNQGISYFDIDGVLVTARHGSFNFIKHEFTLNDGFYRLPIHTHSGASEMWGYAKSAYSQKPNIFEFRSASYTTCSPRFSSWYLYAKELTLNKVEGVGKAKQATLYVQNVPILFLPSYSFLLDNRRRTGWLMPTPRITGASGIGIDVPFYFNLAPNYDFTLTSKLYAKRGLLLNGDFRFLTPSSIGRVWGSWIPHDRDYHKLVSNLPGSEAATATVLEDNGLGSNKSWWRGAISLTSTTTKNKHWHGDIIANYVTDHYFVRDFDVLPSNFGNRDQLLNLATVYYKALNYEFSVKVQGFQTLGSIYNTTLQKQYYRAPEFSFSVNHPSAFARWRWSLDAEVVNFEHDHHDLNIIGVRSYLTPKLERDWNILGAIMTTKVQWFNSFYSINRALDENDTRHRIFRSIPAFSIDSKWPLYRNLGGKLQLLEPRIFYLYVPRVQQDQVPNFDTYLPSFNYHQMFRSNRFAGIDRVGDAHQVTLGFKSLFLTPGGQELFNFALGQTLAFCKHRQWIDGFSVDPLLYRHLSPLVASFNTNLKENLRLNLDGAFDFSYKQRFNNVNAALHYQLDDYRAASFWYHYAVLSDQRHRREWVDFHRIGGSIGWRLRNHWSFLSSLNYNISYKRVDNFALGLEYNSCCWAFRVFYSGELDGFDIKREGKYTRGVFLQLMFKGLSSVSMGSFNQSGNLGVSGYRDIFEHGR